MHNKTEDILSDLTIRKVHGTGKRFYARATLVVGGHKVRIGREYYATLAEAVDGIEHRVRVEAKKLYTKLGYNESGTE